MDDRKEDTRVVRQVHHNHADSSFSLLHLGFAAKTNEVKICRMIYSMNSRTQTKKPEILAAANSA
jgi:hypothetical protein